MKPIKTEDFLRMYKSDPGRIRAPRRYAKIKICGPDRPGRPVQAALKKDPRAQGSTLPTALKWPVGGGAHLRDSCQGHAWTMI